MDRFARSKMHLETENIWKNKIDRDEISYDQLEALVSEFSIENSKEYEIINSSVHTCIIMIDDMQAGLLRLGEIVTPNKPFNLDHLSLFIDNLLTYGTNYLEYRQYHKL